MASSSKVTIVCIKWGTKYPTYYVNRLYGGVSRSMDRPFRFVCYTDDAEGIRSEVEIFPLPAVPFEEELARSLEGQWRKLTIFQPGEAKLSGQCLFLDLDVAVTGPLGPLFDFAPGKFCIVRQWMRHRLKKWIRGIRRSQIVDGEGTAFTFDPVAHRYIMDEFVAAGVKGSSAIYPGEQELTSRTAHRHGDLRHFPDAWIRSFKFHCHWKYSLNLILPPRLPKGCRVVSFHGTPTMDEVLEGSTSHRKLRYWIRPPAWMADHWRE